MSEPVMTIEEAASSIPTACSECGRQTDPRQANVRFKVTGWAKRGKRGGLLNTTLIVQTGEIMCPSCFMRLKQTGSAQQGRLV